MLTEPRHVRLYSLINQSNSLSNPHLYLYLSFITFATNLLEAMSKALDKLGQSRDSMETQAAVVTMTRNKGKTIAVDQRIQQIDESVKEVDWRLSDFILEMYELQRQMHQQFDQIVELLWGKT